MWTHDKIETLKRMWPDNSATEIAETIGTSRNAVIGKANRIGLRKGKASPRPKREKKPREKRPHLPRLHQRIIASVQPRIRLARSMRDEPTKSQLYAMLAQAVRNTAALSI